jgi:prepilin-type N-terminal cleavage/methylation domain-containing protein
MNRLATSRRAGVSLVELLVAMTLLSIALGTIALALSTVQRVDQRLAERQWVAQPRQRLALLFRADVHHAASIQWNDRGYADPPPSDSSVAREPRELLRLTLSDDTQVVYLGETHAVSRLVVRSRAGNTADSAADSKAGNSATDLADGVGTTARDRFDLGRGFSARVAFVPMPVGDSRQESLKTLSLVIASAEEGTLWQVDAAVPAAAKVAYPPPTDAPNRPITAPDVSPGQRSRRRRRCGVTTTRKAHGSHGSHETHKSHTAHTAHTERRGAILVAALVCLLVVAAIAGLVTQRLIRGRRELAQRAAAWQAEWLCESAAQRAVAALKANDAYRGEQWSVGEAEFSGEASVPAAAGEAAIAVTALQGDEGGPRGWRVSVEARYPAAGTWSVRRTKEFTLSKPEIGERR